MKIADQFMVLRRNAGLSQESLAKELNVSRATIVNWERNKTSLPAWAWVSLQELTKQQ